MSTSDKEIDGLRNIAMEMRTYPVETYRPRYVISRHTDHATHAYQVLDRVTGERIGYGLTQLHAEQLTHELEGH